jgi:hypothetical protein
MIGGVRVVWDGNRIPPPRIGRCVAELALVRHAIVQQAKGGPLVPPYLSRIWSSGRSNWSFTTNTVLANSLTGSFCSRK